MVSERPDPEAWTCEVRWKDRRIPAVKAVAKHIFDIRVGATLRGLEATVDGWVAREGGALVLRREDGDERFRLAPLTRKIQWDAASSRDQPPTEEERGAFGRLEAALREAGGAESGSGALPARVVGPVRDVENGGLRVMEVRAFFAGSR